MARAIRTSGMAIAGMMWAAAAAAALQGIELAPTAQVTGDWVNLGDIAAVQPDEQAQALAGTPIAPAPQPGGSRSISAGYVRLRLRAAGVDLTGVAFSGADRVQVTRAPAGLPGRGTAPSVGGGPQEAALMVRRGALVKLVVRAGTMAIETRGELMRDCAVGQVGRFRVEETRATVPALLLDRATAQVMLR